MLREDFHELALAIARVKTVAVESVGVVLPRGRSPLAECAFVVPVDDVFFSAVTRDPFPDPERRAFAFHFRPGVPRDEKLARMAAVLRVPARGPARAGGAAAHAALAGARARRRSSRTWIAASRAASSRSPGTTSPASPSRTASSARTRSGRGSRRSAEPARASRRAQARGAPASARRRRRQRGRAEQLGEPRGEAARAQPAGRRDEDRVVAGDRAEHLADLGEVDRARDGGRAPRVRADDDERGVRGDLGDDRRGTRRGRPRSRRRRRRARTRSRPRGATRGARRGGRGRARASPASRGSPAAASAERSSSCVPIRRLRMMRATASRRRSAAVTREVPSARASRRRGR